MLSFNLYSIFHLQLYSSLYHSLTVRTLFILMLFFHTDIQIFKEKCLGEQCYCVSWFCNILHQQQSIGWYSWFAESFLSQDNRVQASFFGLFVCLSVCCVLFALLLVLWGLYYGHKFVLFFTVYWSSQAALRIWMQCHLTWNCTRQTTLNMSLCYSAVHMPISKPSQSPALFFL